MKWLKGIALVLGALIAVAAIAPFFVTLNDYIPALEKEISARLGEPVSIDSLHAALLPVPHVRIEGIAIGTAQDVKLARVTLKPDLWSLLRSPKVIRSIELDNVTLTHKALGGLATLSQGDRGAGSWRIERVRVSDAVVNLERSKFGPFEVDVRVSGPIEPGLVTLKTRDGALEAKAIPDGAHFKIEIAGRNWTPPIGPAFVFDELDAKGVIRVNDAELAPVSAKLYGGTASGKVTLAWDKGIAVKGNLDVRQIELQQPVALLSPSTRLSGRLDAKPLFSAHAQTADQLDDSLRVESAFAVHNGVVHGFDIAAAAASFGKHSRGGQTRFDELTGGLLLDRRSYRFGDLRIASGVLAARGTLNISPSKALSGQLKATATVLGRSLAMPLDVSGTLDSPMLTPDANALAGAMRSIRGADGADLGGLVEGLLSGRKR